MTKERIDVASLSLEQLTALLEDYQKLENARRAHAIALLGLLEQPVPGDGRDFHAVLSELSPMLVKHLSALLVKWIDLGNGITETHNEQISRILAGRPAPTLN